MNINKTKVLGLLPVTLMVVTLFAGTLGVSSAMADNGESRNAGNSTAAKVQVLRHDIRGLHLGKIKHVATSTVATSTVGRHEGSGNGTISADFMARLQALIALVQQLEARLVSIQQGGVPVATTTDVTAPVISLTASANTTDSAADITWNTNELATSKVYVSTSSPVNLVTAQILSNATLVLGHDVHLSGLASSTSYFYIVESADAAGNISRSSQFSFTTTVTPDVTAPVISSTTATNVASTTASITWATSELATSKVYVSTSSPVNLATAATVSDATLAVNHSLNLSGLTASTTYFYVVQSGDAANNIATSTQQSFVTSL